MSTRRLAFPTVLLLALSACQSGDDMPVEDNCGPDKNCPEGYTCDLETMLCYKDGSSNDIDAGADAARPDASESTPDGGSLRPDATVRPDAAPRVDATVDSDPPQTTLDQGPPARSNSLTATFYFSSDEPGSTFLCSLDGAEPAPCDSPATFPVSGEGDHTFTVTAVDPSGNPDGSPASVTWFLDLTPPMTTIDEGPVGTVASSDAHFVFSSNEPGSFLCSYDGAPEGICMSPLDLSGVELGGHSFTVRALDEAGNPDPSPASRNWTVDTSAPITTIDTGPTGFTQATTATFTFHANKPNSTFDCDLDGAGYDDCTGGSVSYSSLGDRLHTFSVRATDPQGTTGLPTKRQWTVDNTDPVVTITVGPEAVSADRSPSFIFDPGAGDPECQLDNDGFGPCTSSTTMQYVNLDDGTYTFTVRATDDAGNSGQDTATFTVDTSGPATTTITAQPANPSNDPAPVFEFTSEAGASFFCKLDTDGDYTPCASGDAFPVTSGVRTFSVYAVDGAGNPDLDGDSYTWTVNLEAPTTEVYDPVPSDPSNDPAPPFYFGCDEGGCTFHCWLDSSPDYFPCETGDTFPVADGERTFRVYATDAAGNDDPFDMVYTWNVDTQAPAVTEIDDGPPAVTATTMVSFTFHADEAGAAFYCMLDTDADFAPCASGDDFLASPGDRTFYVYATDDAGNGTPADAATWEFTVDASPPDTTIDTGPDPAVVSTTASFTFHSSKANSTFMCGLDLGAYSATAYVSCSTPYDLMDLGPGTHTLSVYAIDGAGTADPSPTVWTWQVATGDGHVVLMGLDFSGVDAPASFPDAANFVGNAALLANPKAARVEVLFYRGGATADEVNRANDAIKWRVTNLFRDIDFTELDDKSSLEKALVGKNVFVVDDQNGDGSGAEATSLGSDWGKTLRAWVAQGGVLIVLDGLSQSQLPDSIPSHTAYLLRAAGLLSMPDGGSYVPEGQTISPDAQNSGDPLVKNVNIQGFAAPKTAVIYPQIEANYVLRYDNPVAVHKTYKALETFEYGDPAKWEWLPWHAASAMGTGGTVASDYAFEGKYGVRDTGWKYRTDLTIDKDTDRISAWIRFTPGAVNVVYLGIGASADGTKSVYLDSGEDPARTQIGIMDNGGWKDDISSSGITDLPLAWNTWYLLEAQVTGQGSYLVARVYDQSGKKLGQIQNDGGFQTQAFGGVAIRTRGGGLMDSISYHIGRR